MDSELLIRTGPPIEGQPLWAGIAFVHPIDSDELAECLKRRYPGYGTHRQRKLRAVIDFLGNELYKLQQEQSQMSTNNRRSASYSSTHLYPPEGLASLCLQSPTGSMRSAELSEQLPQTGNISLVDVISPEQHVFDSRDGQIPNHRKKRKMTQAEKIAYRETRQRGACRKCKAAKARCTHLSNKSVMDGGTHGTNCSMGNPEADPDKASSPPEPENADQPFDPIGDK